MVERTGFEPVTPTLPVSCAPSCANAPRLFIISSSAMKVKKKCGAPFGAPQMIGFAQYFFSIVQPSSPIVIVCRSEA